MAKDIQTIDNDDLGPIPDVFRDTQIDVKEFLGGIQPSFPVLSIKGGKFGVKFGGETTQFTEPNARAGGQIMPVTFLDVVIVAVAPRINKAFYIDPVWNDTKRDPPDCWSVDGIRPDDSIPAAKKQNAVCGTCPQNQRGSKVANGKLLRACTDIQRVALVRIDEIDNPLGPILHSIKPGSFSNFSTYVQWLAGRHRTPFMVVTRMTFDIKAEYPKNQFMAARGLTNEEANRIAEIQKHPIIDTILNSKNAVAFVDPEQDEQDAAGGLPPTGGLPPADAPAKPGWEKTATVINRDTPPPAEAAKMVAEAKVVLAAEAKKGTLSPELQRIADLEAQLAAAKAPKPEPKPEPVLTPEQLKIRELEAQLAQAKSPKTRGRPRTTPVGPPTSTAAAAVTAPSNGSSETETTSAGTLNNDLDSRINKLVGP